MNRAASRGKRKTFADSQPPEKRKKKKGSLWRIFSLRMERGALSPKKGGEEKKDLVGRVVFAEKGQRRGHVFSHGKKEGANRDRRNRRKKEGGKKKKGANRSALNSRRHRKKKTVDGCPWFGKRGGGGRGKKGEAVRIAAPAAGAEGLRKKKKKTEGSRFSTS